MPVSVTMPRLGESVTEGTVTRWLKQEGDRVEADEPLLEVSTDKVDTEIPSPAAGVLTKIVVQEDETAEVGSELAVIAGDGDTGSAAPAAQPTQAPPATVPAAQAAPTPAPAPVQPAYAAPGTATPTTDAISASVAGDGQTAPPVRADGGGTTVVTMPALGESVTEGTVTRWLKQVGEQVEADEALLEVSTDKVDTEIPTPAGGTLLEIKVPEDETAPVGAELAIIGTTASAPAPVPSAAAPRDQGDSAAGLHESAPKPLITSGRETLAPAEAGIDGAGGYVTPLVRKLATEHGVDLSAIHGTGVGGRIRKQDVIEAADRQRAARAAAQPAAPLTAPPAKASQPVAEPSPLRGTTEKLTRTRALIAKRMLESLQTSAQLTTVVEVDVTKVARLREHAKADFLARNGVKLSFLPFFAQATVEALRIHPRLNASIDTEAGTVTYHDAEHLGMAVDTERGLMVPVIHHAGDLNLSGLAKRIADLAERTRTNKLSPDDVSGATFTLTNTGSRGALFDTPIFTPPQVGIIGTGAVVKRAVVVDDPDLGELILPRSMAYLALSYDHRLVDGADAARFLAAIKERLEAGSFETELGLA